MTNVAISKVDAIVTMALTLVFIGGVTLLVLAADHVVRRSRIIARLRREMREMADAAPTEVPGPVSDDLHRANDFVRIGFEHLTTLRADTHEVIVLFRAADSAVAEVAHYPRLPEPVLLELTSSVAGGRGVVCTSSLGRSPALWWGELRQEFPGATAEDLVLRHTRGLEYLASLGLAADHLDVDDVLPWRELTLKRSAMGVANMPSAEIRRRALRIAVGGGRYTGPFEDQPDIADRVKDLWAAVTSTRP